LVVSREATLSSLIRFDTSLTDLKTALASLPWDADPVVILTRRDIAAVLERHARSEFDAAVVEEWANLLECREDVRFEPGHEETVASAIHDLANPELQGQLQAIAPDLLSTLR
jgi:hypothetical protein